MPTKAGSLNDSASQFVAAHEVTCKPSHVPFTTYVVKVVSRCNLNCSYCYMYNLADRTYRNQPKVMADSVSAALAERIARHAMTRRLDRVHIILHGGEPLLMGKDRLRSWVELLRSRLTPCVRPFFSIQSNGTLVDDEWVDLLADLGVLIGISVDGPREFHDKCRIDHSGVGSFDDVIQGIRVLQKHPRGKQVFSCVLAVVNTDIPPAQLFDFWEYLDVEGFDLSLPHANHLHAPPEGKASYGEWMVQFFDLWFDANRPDRHVRYFENILRMLFGYPISTDNIGGKPVGVVVVETDGSIEPTDAFKCCEEGITKLGVNVIRDDFDALYAYPMVATLQNGVTMLCDRCQACALRDVCGGGYMPHRYSKERGFDNPSVYCDDLQTLIYHIRDRAIAALPPEILRELSGRRVTRSALSQCVTN
jgi:uncharacterized protein